MNASTKLLSIAAAAALVGCAANYPYSQLDGYRYYHAAIDTYPVQITKVDGKSTPASEAPVRIDPGTHVVSVQTYPTRFDPYRDERNINLDVKPCTHYYLVAVKPTRLSRDYDVKVDYEQPVPGCTPPR